MMTGDRVIFFRRPFVFTSGNGVTLFRAGEKASERFYGQVLVLLTNARENMLTSMGRG